MTSAMDLIARAAAWVEDYAGPTELVVGFHLGSDDAECGVAWVSAEGPQAFGHLTVWESGVVAIETYDTASGNARLWVRTTAASNPELSVLLGELIRSCASSLRLSHHTGQMTSLEPPPGEHLSRRS